MSSARWKLPSIFAIETPCGLSVGSPSNAAAEAWVVRTLPPCERSSRGGGPCEAWWRGSRNRPAPLPLHPASRGPPPHLRWGGNSPHDALGQRRPHAGPHPGLAKRPAGPAVAGVDGAVRPDRLVEHVGGAVAAAEERNRPPLGIILEAAARESEDRKSTRLNSSH